MHRAGSVLLAVALFLPVSASAATFVVDDNGTAADAAIDGNCQTSGGVCTLRAAIEEANATAALDVIHFSGSMTIDESALPSITQPVRIDGEANSVEIRGTTITFDGTSDGSRIERVTISNSPSGGILAASTNVTVAGTTITGNQFFGIRATASDVQIGGTGDGDTNVIGGTTSGSGIEVYAPNATIIANLIGTDATGTTPNPSSHGIYVNGGNADIRANVISGNGGNGIWAEAVTGLIVDGNRIGTDGAGSAALGNGGTGVFLNGTTGATINANVIAANNSGIVVQNGSSNVITNNFIGTDATATLDLGHTYAGIRITSSSADASDNTVTSNVVAFNQTGIEIAEFGAAADRNRLSQNRVFANVQIGVDLQSLSSGAGTTSNDAGDGDAGANDLQNYPSLSCISSDGSSTTFVGSLNSAPNTTYRVEIFSNAACESSAGRTYLGFTNVTTDASGDATISVTLPVAVPVGTPITATATDPLGNASEYSNCGFVNANSILVSSDYFAWEPDGVATISVFRPAVPEAATVDYALSDGTAVSPDDYTAVSGTLSFAACETSKTISVPVVDDSIDEEAETATITFSNPTGGATLNRTSAVLVIEDDDEPPVVTITSDAAAIAENGGTATLTLALDHASSQDVTVTLAFGGTATSGGDYSGASTPVTIPAMQTAAALTITALDDVTHEGDETITAEITGATNASAGSPAAATITISDDDPFPSITVDDVTAGEGDATAQFTITLSNPTTDVVTVDFATSDGTAAAPDDYLAASGQITFAPGVTTQAVDVTVVDDSIDETDETATITLSNPTGGATLDRATAVLVIEDNDEAPVVTMTSGAASIAESGGTATLTLTLDRASSQDVTVTLAFGGTATAGSDYSGATTPVTIPAMQTTATLTITAIDDGVHERDEIITADITGATNASVGSPAAATITILEDDPFPTIAVADASAAEADGTMQFTITLSNATTDVVTADFTTVDGTATAPADYGATSGQITFSPGVMTRTVDVPIVDDVLFEPDETLQLHVTNASNTANAEASGTGTILNDDAEADLSIVKSGPRSVGANESFDYLITVTNAGPGAATNVTVTDALPPSVVLDSFVASQGSCTGTTTVVCNLGTLANGASATIALTVHVTMTAGTFTNSASVTADQTDPSPANDSSSATAAIAVAQVPTVSEWMLIALAAMLGLLAVRRV